MVEGFALKMGGTFEQVGQRWEIHGICFACWPNAYGLGTGMRILGPA